MKSRGLRWGSIGLASCLLLCVGAIGTFGVLLYFNADSHIAPGVTKNRLLTLRPGLSEDEVFRLLGQPLYVGHEPAGIGEHDPPSMRRLVYGRPTTLFLGGFEIDVTTLDGRLSWASVEYYDLLEYRCNESGCPVAVRDPTPLDKLNRRWPPSWH
jgi:hypothetical protein